MAYDITFALDLFNRGVDPEESLYALNVLIRALAEIDAEYLRRHPETPLLYKSNIPYVPEQESQERWQDIPTTLKRRQGDCEDLAAWRAAELNVRAGIDARPEVYVSKVFPDGRRLYHVIVRLPNWDVEDPSFILGMRAPSTNSLVSR